MRRFLVIILSLLALCLVLASCEDTAPYVVGAGYDTDNNLILEYSDGSTLNLGKINQKGEQGEQGIQGDKGEQGDKGDTGEKGENGVGISKAEIVNGELVITYTDGTVQNLGKITQSEQNEENFTDGLDFYPLPDGTYGVGAGNTEYLEEIVIPSKYNGKSVTKIRSEGFKESTNLKKITIPSSVTAIGRCAFLGCTSLTSVTIPNSVTSIGNSAFSGCSSLTSITIPSGVTSIDNDAFYGCISLKSVTIPNSVTSIGEYAFSGCISLKSVTIPNSVTSISIGAFDYCKSLTSIEVDKNNTAYKSIDGNLYSKDGKTLVQYAVGKSDTSFAIPNSVTSIGSSAFSDCSWLKSITIPNSVASIGEYAFYNCSSLTKINCEAQEKPSGWDYNWNNGCHATVNWGYTGE